MRPYCGSHTMRRDIRQPPALSFLSLATRPPNLCHSGGASLTMMVQCIGGCGAQHTAQTDSLELYLTKIRCSHVFSLGPFWFLRSATAAVAATAFLESSIDDHAYPGFASLVNGVPGALGVLQRKRQN